MKTIINEKKYDTETAQKMYEIKRRNTSLGEDISSILYKKTNGEYFVWVKCSNYSQTLWENIYPKSQKSAKEWCEENHITVDDYEKIFGEVSE